MCPICGELDAASGYAIVPVAFGGDCKGRSAHVFDDNADATGCLSCESPEFVGGVLLV